MLNEVILKESTASIHQYISLLLEKHMVMCVSWKWSEEKKENLFYVDIVCCFMKHIRSLFVVY